jgi:hypothetical protein
MLVSHYQKVGPKHSIKTTNKTFENVAKFKYSGTLTDQNQMHKEIKSSLNLGNACYHSIQSLLSSCLLSRNVKVKKYKTTVLPAVLYGCETLALASRDEHKLRVFENMVLRTISGPKRDKVLGEWRKLHNAELHNMYSYSRIIRQIKAKRMRWVGHVAHMQQERKVTRFWWESLKETHHLKSEAKMGPKSILGRLDGCGADSPGSG